MLKGVVVEGRGSHAPSPIPPPEPILTSTPLLDGGEKSTILCPDAIEQLDYLLPECYQRYKWRLLFSIERDGSSFTSFYTKVRKHSPTILVIRTTENEIFGGFTTTPWEPKPEYYGTGESFLFKIRPYLDNHSHAQRLPPVIQFFPWARQNTYYMHSTEESIGMGGGGGEFGLLIGADFNYGTSGSSDTFFNAPLAHNKTFQIAQFECWTLQQAIIADKQRRIATAAGGGGGGGGGGVFKDCPPSS